MTGRHEVGKGEGRRWRERGRQGSDQVRLGYEFVFVCLFVFRFLFFNCDGNLLQDFHLRNAMIFLKDSLGAVG